MAKDSDNLAGSFETEDAGGLLTGFLAEEDDFDRRSLWRLGSWGVGAVGCVIVAVLANQSAIGSRREQIASADLARQSQQIQSIARESQNETRRLASAIETLNGDRDRLYSRITVLEQGLDSVTGSIARQNAAAASPQATSQSASIGPSQTPPTAPVSPSTSASAPSSAPSASTASSAMASLAPAKAEPPMTPTTAPAVAPVATAAAAKGPAMPDKPPPVAAASEPGSASSEQLASNAPAATPTTPLMPAKSIMAPPDAAAAKLTAPDAPPDAPAATAPEAVAAASPADEAQADAAASTVQRTEFAVDVGTANSVGGLRALWRGLLKSKSNAALAALRPIIVVKESNTGLGMQLRLAAGPLSDAAAAAKICAVLMEGKRTSCETTVFDGQQLAMKDDEPAASAKPAAVRPAVRRRPIARRVTVEEPPKPQPTTLSSFFGR
jgi:hypothetical protein